MLIFKSFFLFFSFRFVSFSLFFGLSLILMLFMFSSTPFTTITSGIIDLRAAGDGVNVTVWVGMLWQFIFPHNLSFLLLLFPFLLFLGKS